MNSRLFHEDDLQIADNILDPFEPPMDEQDDFLSSTVVESTLISGQTPPHQYNFVEQELEVPVKKEEEVFTVPELCEAGDKGARKGKDRIKDKIAKAKEKFPEIKKLIKKEETPSKKQLQLMRNRISAQRSRDRKRKELTEFGEENKKLLEEMKQLHQQLLITNNELAINQKVVDSLSEPSQKEYYRIRTDVLNTSSFAQDDVEWAGRPSGGRFRNPLMMATMFLACLCIVACFAPMFMGGSSPLVTVSTTGTQLMPRLLETADSRIESRYPGPKLYSLAELQ